MNKHKLVYIILLIISSITAPGIANATSASAYLQNFSLVIYDTDVNFDWKSLKGSVTTSAGSQSGYAEQIGLPAMSPFIVASSSSDGINTAAGELSFEDNDGSKISAEVNSASALTSSYSNVIIPFAYKANSILVFSADAELNLNAASGEYVWGVAGISIQGFNVENVALGGDAFLDGVSYSESKTLTSVYSAPFDHTVYFLATSYVVADFSNSISAVPEPSAYALLLVGLGFISIAARQRRNSRSS